MLEWSPIFETRLKLIDTQHQSLFDMVNKLNASLLATDRNEKNLNQLMSNLMDYAQQHFADEELLMARYKLDEKYLLLQRMEHKSFIYNITQMHEQISSSDDLMNRFDKLAQFTTSWLVYHTLRTDLLIPKQIIEIKNGKTASEAYEIAKHTGYEPEVTKKILNAVLQLWEETTRRVRELEGRLKIAK